MKRTLKNLAFALLGRENVHKLAAKWLPTRFVQEINAIRLDPLNSECHLALAERHLGKGGNPYIAFSQLQTARFLGNDMLERDYQKWVARIAIPRKDQLPHNSFFRFTTLAEHIAKIADGRPINVLDVGGGYGQLATFLPDNIRYCLAEPSTNGISGEHLPFADESFDVVTSCHVLEHIPRDDRTIFLDSLVRNAREAVVLLNPFQIDGSDHQGRQQLVYDITHAAWAKEHIDCIMPRPNSIRDYAQQRGFRYEIEPNGSAVLSLALVFLDYFADRAGQRRD